MAVWSLEVLRVYRPSIWEIKRDNYYVKDKNGNKIKWLSIGDNKNLADNIELSKAIWRWVKTQDDVTCKWWMGKSDVENGIIKAT